jgi:hypothetical protein
MSGPVSESNVEKVKYIDDGTVAVSINLKCLTNDPVSRPRPLNFHERPEHILPPENNLLQFYLEGVHNKSRKWDFPPEVGFPDDCNLEVVSEMKLLGVIVSSDLRWVKNTVYICQRAMERMWILRRMGPTILILTSFVTHMSRRFGQFWHSLYLCGTVD